MIPALRREFNARFTPGRYRRFLELLDARCGTPVRFRNSETPLFLPREVLDQMVRAGAEMVQQLLGNADYQKAAAAAIPAGYDTPGALGKPLFVQADFGLAASAEGALTPKLVEIQGFPSLYAYQPVLSRCYREAYALDPALEALPGALSEPAYDQVLRRAMVGEHDPENVILLEIEPWQQKTSPDFLETERRYAVRTVDIRDVRRRGRSLFYQRDGREVPIRRIYNRAIADELIRKQVALPFSFQDDLEVEWAGHPNWFFLISKYSLPWLRHPAVPRTWFLDQMPAIPDDLRQYVLKPLYSFAGRGVVVGPTRADIEAVARDQYILQERVDFVPTVETPHGATKCEVRIMYVYLEELRAVNTIVRMGRGSMMGVDQNRELEWVGASAAFIQ